MAPLSFFPNPDNANAGIHVPMTALARRFYNAEFVGNYLFPTVIVSQRSGIEYEFSKTQFQVMNDLRSPGARYPEMQFGYEGRPYKLEDRGLQLAFTQESEEEARIVGLDLGSLVPEDLMNGVGLSLESQQAEIASNPANYDSDNVFDLGPGEHWDETDPEPLMREAASIITLKTGKRPNLLLFGNEAFDGTSGGAAVRARMIHTNANSLTEDMLGTMFNMKKVVVGRAVGMNTPLSNPSFLWGNIAILAYVNPTALKTGRIPYEGNSRISRYSQSFGYTKVRKGHPYVDKPRFCADTKTKKTLVTYQRHPSIVAPGAGVLIRNVASA